MALSRAEGIINSDVRASEVNLEGLGLESLEPLLPLLAVMPRLKSLRLARNGLTGLPDDLSAIRQLEFMDLSSNPVTGLSTIMRGLYSLVVLRHLSVDLPFASEEDELIIALPALESLNGTSLIDTMDGEETIEKMDEAMHDKVEKAEKAEKPERAELPAERPSPPHREETPAVWSAEDTRAAQSLFAAVSSAAGSASGQREFSVYVTEVVQHLDALSAAETDPACREGEALKARRVLGDYCAAELLRAAVRRDAALGDALAAVFAAQSALFERYDRHWRRVAADREERLGGMKRDMQDAIREIESLMGQVGQAPDAAEVRRAHEEVGWLRAENARLQTKLRMLEASPSPQAVAARHPSVSASAERSGASPSPSHAVGGKVLTLKQLKSAMEEIYASKSKYDIKCSESHLPRETMEQHMYTYLNQRYGLKHIILDWATAIIQGIKKYGPDDNDIAVFGKILRNEIDEEFRFVQRQVRETVHELLRVYVKGKRLSKSDMEINRLVQAKVASSLAEDEWVDIVKYMYNAEDAVSIIMRVRDHLRQISQPHRRRAIQRKQEPPMESVQLLYADLIRILLDFQLEGHERFLSRFLRIFREHDTDRNGIVNEQEFGAIVCGVDSTKTEEEITALLELVDPYSCQLITYSECVTYLSADIVKMMKGEE